MCARETTKPTVPSLPPTSQQGSDVEHLILTLTHKINLDWMYVENQKSGSLLKKAPTAVIVTPT